ncbi:MAG: hypothetical protein NVS9B1_08590 [Candidatus Dormibacteraceae bacterium]
MENANTSQIAGWFAGRLPDGWFTGTPDVTVEGDQILVVGTLPEVDLGSAAAAEVKAAAGEGRISRFRGYTRRERIWIAREAEELFKKNVTWGARSGDTRVTFTPGGSGRGEGKAEAGAAGGGVNIGGRRFGRRRSADTRVI